MPQLPRLIFPFGLLAMASLAIAPAAASAAPTKLDPARFQLRREENNSALGRLPLTKIKKLSVVLDDANRPATRIPPSLGKKLVKNFAAGFQWHADDANTAAWFPQGITTSSDAYADGLYEGRKVVLVSWYDHTASRPNKGVRVSFVDRTDPLKPRYRHVLLVEPYSADGRFTSFHALSRDKEHPDTPLHAGGIFWYGDLLYVVDTGDGFRVFNLNDIMQVSTASACDNAIGRTAGGDYCAYGYKYVLPQKFTYTPTSNNNLRFSFTSLDRTTKPDSILVGEYDAKGKGTRLVRWDIDSHSRELVAKNGRATATWAYQVDIESMQGGASLHGKYFLTRSNGETKKGDLITWTPGQRAEPSPQVQRDLLPPGPALLLDGDRGGRAEPQAHGGVFPPGPEDLSYRPSTKELWTVTEWPGNLVVPRELPGNPALADKATRADRVAKRMVIAVKADEF